MSEITVNHGQTPTEFIRSIGLGKAEQLLQNCQALNCGNYRHGRVSNTPRYFTKCFKKKHSEYYHSEYSNAHRKSDSFKIIRLNIRDYFVYTGGSILFLRWMKTEMEMRRNTM